MFRFKQTMQAQQEWCTYLAMVLLRTAAIILNHPIEIQQPTTPNPLDKTSHIIDHNTEHLFDDSNIYDEKSPMYRQEMIHSILHYSEMIVTVM